MEMSISKSARHTSRWKYERENLGAELSCHSRDLKVNNSRAEQSERPGMRAVGLVMRSDNVSAPISVRCSYNSESVSQRGRSDPIWFSVFQSRGNAFRLWNGRPGEAIAFAP